jgi:hypothetical protein
MYWRRGGRERSRSRCQHGSSRSRRPSCPPGLALALVATVRDGAAGPLDPAVRPALAILLLAGWVALTVAGSLLHLLTVLARVRHFAVKMPAPRASRDRAVAALAILAVITWALAQAPGLSILDVPALALRISAALVIAGHIVVAAAHAGVPRLRAAPGSPAGRQATRRPLRSPGHP